MKYKYTHSQLGLECNRGLGLQAVTQCQGSATCHLNYILMYVLVSGTAHLWSIHLFLEIEMV